MNATALESRIAELINIKFSAQDRLSRRIFPQFLTLTRQMPIRDRMSALARLRAELEFGVYKNGGILVELGLYKTLARTPIAGAAQWAA